MTRSLKGPPPAGAQIYPKNPVAGLKPRTKQAAVVDMLNRETGASQADLPAATGKPPHTVRVALTGLRKRGLIFTRTKIDCVTRYTVDAA